MSGKAFGSSPWPIKILRVLFVLELHRGDLLQTEKFFAVMLKYENNSLFLEENLRLSAILSIILSRIF